MTLKKLEEVIGSGRTPSEETLQRHVMQRVIGVQVDSCEEFAGLWEKYQGAYKKQESQRSIEANQARSQGKISKRKEVCSVVKRYSECMKEYIAQEKKYDGSRRLDGDYNQETGLYREQTIGESISGWWNDDNGVSK